MQKEFGTVKDPRVLGKVKYPLEDVLRIALIGSICSCEDFEEVYDFVSERQADLVAEGFLSLPNDLPSADTTPRCRGRQP